MSIPDISKIEEILCNHISIILEIWSLLGFGRCVIGWAVLKISKDHSVFIFCEYLTLKISALWSFETMVTTYPMTQCHITEDLNPQQHNCESLKSQKTIFSSINIISWNRQPQTQWHRHNSVTISADTRHNQIHAMTIQNVMSSLHCLQTHYDSCDSFHFHCQFQSSYKIVNGVVTVHRLYQGIL
jgi:hypothetical protein